MGERLGEGLVGPADALVAAAVEHDRATRMRRQRRLGQQPRLADSRLAADEEGTALAGTEPGRRSRIAASSASRPTKGQRAGSPRSAAGSGTREPALSTSRQTLVPAGPRLEGVPRARERAHDVADERLALPRRRRERERLVGGGPPQLVGSAHEPAVRDPDPRREPALRPLLRLGGGRERRADALELGQQHAVALAQLADAAGDGGALRRGRAADRHRHDRGRALSWRRRLLERSRSMAISAGHDATRGGHARPPQTRSR